MPWLFPAILVTAFCTFVLVLVYLYLYKIEGHAFTGLWALGWLCYLVTQSIDIWMILNGESIFLLTINHTAFLLSSFFLMWGCHSFLDRKLDKRWFYIFTVTALWMIAGDFFNLSYLVQFLPVFILSGATYIYIGIVILKSRKIDGIPKYTLGTCFIIWGVHLWDCPFLNQFNLFLDLGFMLCAVIEMIVAISFILTYFNNNKRDLIRTQEILVASENKLNSIIENQQDIIFELDSNRSFIFCSPASVEILNRSPEELVGESFDSIIGSLINIAQMGDNNGRYSFETSAEINGFVKCLNINCKSNYNREEKFVGAFGSIRDITEQKKLQEVTEYNKIKTEFFANMSHELRTPINVILAAIQLLESYNKDILDDENDRMSRYIRTMKQNSYRLVRLINNLIDITKAEAGFLDIHLKNQNIVSIVEDITLSIVEYTNSKGINLQFDTDFEEMITSCDADKIERIMLNLLSNAIKHTARGGNILVTIKQRDENAVISIKDNGVGIPKDKLKLIFERFVQVDKSLNRLNEGSGIGLSITKSLVELHEGNISAFSIPGEGSEFVFTIPIRSVEEATGLDDRRNDSSILEKINIEFSDIYS